MNTADRSLTAIDIALRRRFVFEEVEPIASNLEGVEIAGVDLAKLLDTMNARIEALLDRDHRIGHAYFLSLSAADDIAQLRHVFATQVIPLLQEYFFDDWRRIRLVLNDHRKDNPADRFVVERDESIEQLLGPGDIEVPTSRAWRPADHRCRPCLPRPGDDPSGRV
jgi:5-methylcytosine-specific restriction protein B